MGAVSSSPLERRQTVLRRSQRKSIFGVKAKTGKLHKDIKKFKGVDEEDKAYVNIKTRIEALEKELVRHSKTLQPQLRNLYAEALNKTEECFKLLASKLEENRGKAEEEEPQQANEEHANEEAPKDEDDDVFVEQTPQTVELKLVQIEQIPSSPQINKRFSAMKIGVPVLPGSIMESSHRKSSLAGKEERISALSKKISELEVEISQFIGRRNGNYYTKLKNQLDGFVTELHDITTNDEEVLEQIKTCAQYIRSCMTFLDEKADGSDYEDIEDVEPAGTNDSSLSPRSMRTTYV